tara:strand:- start:2463 stop:2666 length:204 start_codon:yes stop_codon:yes gene_type:complete
MGAYGRDRATPSGRNQHLQAPLEGGGAHAGTAAEERIARGGVAQALQVLQELAALLAPRVVADWQGA